MVSLFSGFRVVGIRDVRYPTLRALKALSHRILNRLEPYKVRYLSITKSCITQSPIHQTLPRSLAPFNKFGMFKLLSIFI